MKRIPLRDRGQFKAREIILTILNQPSGGSGINVSDMRKRCRVEEQVERQQGSYADLEDADHALLVSLMNTFPFGISHRNLLQILDDIANAKSPEETPQFKLVDGEAG